MMSALGSRSISTPSSAPVFEPPQLLRDMVAEGKLGKKTGQGFYTWD